MKIRHGFVSNSSSSSFLIYGVALDHEEFITKAMEAGFKFKDSEDVEFETLDEVIENVDLYDAVEQVEQVKFPKDITFEMPYESYTVYIGASWDTVKDSETGKEFKDRVFEKLKKLGFATKKSDVETLSEAWYNG